MKDLMGCQENEIIENIFAGLLAKVALSLTTFSEIADLESP